LPYVCIFTTLNEPQILHVLSSSFSIIKLLSVPFCVFFTVACSHVTGFGWIILLVTNDLDTISRTHALIHLLKPWNHSTVQIKNQISLGKNELPIEGTHGNLIQFAKNLPQYRLLLIFWAKKIKRLLSSKYSWVLSILMLRSFTRKKNFWNIFRWDRSEPYRWLSIQIRTPLYSSCLKIIILFELNGTN
jgi:hypothetical protein